MADLVEKIEASERQPHPLDGCDVDECYKTMMAERTDLIKARREAEDNLVKTIVQLSATLIALISGFVTQTSVRISAEFIYLLVFSLILLVGALASGPMEHVFSSKAYQAQQTSVEQFYTKQINSFKEPAANHWVRRCQMASFSSFVLALILLAAFALLQAGEKSNAKANAAPTTSASTPTATSSTTTNSPARQFRGQGTREQ